jgi:ribosomal protein S18 acetylase RimI-like enzyme
MDNDIIIRPYTPKDRQDVYQIAADTAFFGQPVEAFLDDRSLFCDAFIAYYTGYEAEYCWVAISNDRVIGYLAGCVDTKTQRRRIITKNMASVVRKALQGRYILSSKTWHYARSMGLGVLRNEYPKVNYDKFPAHLHINVEAGKRGQGIGQRLMAAYLEQLRQLAVPGVFLDTTNLNEAACKLYERVGFQMLDSRPTRVWSYLIEQLVENRIYGLKLIIDT